MTKIALMVTNSTLKRLPSERVENRIVEGLQEKGRAGSLTPSLFKRKSGFAMARLVSLAIVLSSCSYNLAPTTAQREQKKFERFKVAPTEAIVYSGSAFLGYGLGKNYFKPIR